MLGWQTQIGISQRVADILGTQLQNSGCLILPLTSQTDPYHYLHPAIVDALNPETFICYPPTSPEKTIMGYLPLSIDLYQLHLTDELKQATIFILPQHPRTYLVTDWFDTLIKQHGFTNYRTVTIWDSDKPGFNDDRYTPEQIQFYIDLKHKRQQEQLEKERNKIGPAQLQNPLPSAFTTNNLIQNLEANDHQHVRKVHNNATTLLQETFSLNPQQFLNTSFMVEKIEQIIDNIRQRSPQPDETWLDPRAIELGVYYAELVVQTHGWHWLKIDDEFAICAPDRSVFMYPVGFVYPFLAQPRKELTVLLFNMMGNPSSFATVAKPGELRLITS